MSHINKRKGLLILAGGLSLLLFGPYLIPVPPLTGVLPPEKLGDDDSQFVEINGQNVHVKKMGQGEPVFLLLHGFASSLYSWNAVMEPLSKQGTVIAFDRTGFGLSERPINWQGQNPYSAETQVELAVGLLDHFGVEKAILVGNSAGGTIAMQTALEYPERVSAMVLVDPAVYNGGGAPQWLKPLLASPQMRRLGPLVSRQILKRGQNLIKLAWYNPAKLSPETLAEYQKPFQVENWDKGLWEFTLASRSTGLVEHLSQLTIPTLVITGDHDRIVPTEDSIRLSGELPNAQLEVIPDAGHVPHEEQSDMFLNAVNKFLNSLNP